MGGCCNKQENESSDDEPPIKQYSWDKRRKEIDPKDFMLEDIDGKTIVKPAGSINGQQFVLNNCVNSTIILLDHLDSMTIDKCENCILIIGPVRGSIFLRNCKSCICVAACQQFRTRDSSNIDILLCCTTQPIIEASYKMRFGCYHLFYNGLKNHFKSANLQIFNNTWYKIYDFTPNPDGKNFGWIASNFNLSDKIDLESLQYQESEETNVNNSCLPKNMEITFEKAKSVVPVTRGQECSILNEPGLIVIFFHDEMNEVALKLIHELTDLNVDLLATKYVELSNEIAEEIFKDDKYKKLVSLGPIIALELDGENCVNKCHDVSKKLNQDVTLFISSASSAESDIETINQKSDMQMQ